MGQKRGRRSVMNGGPGLDGFLLVRPRILRERSGLELRLARGCREKRQSLVMSRDFPFRRCVLRAIRIGQSVDEGSLRHGIPRSHTNGMALGDQRRKSGDYEQRYLAERYFRRVRDEVAAGRIPVLFFDGVRLSVIRRLLLDLFGHRSVRVSHPFFSDANGLRRLLVSGERLFGAMPRRLRNRFRFLTKRLKRWRLSDRHLFSFAHIR